MTLEEYVAGITTVRSAPTYPWSDWEIRDYFRSDMEDGFLCDMSDAAAMALTLATATWIDNRFAALDSDPMLAQVIAAGWAYMLEPAACFYFEPDEAEWNGPVRGAKATAVILIMDALFCRDAEPNVRVRANWMCNLARYVLEQDVETFDAWFNWASNHVTTVHPRSEMPNKGLFEFSFNFEPVVGPDVFIPESDYDPAMARVALIAHVRAHSIDNEHINPAALHP